MIETGSIPVAIARHRNLQRIRTVILSFLISTLTVHSGWAQLDQKTIRFVGEVLVGTEYGSSIEDQVCVRWETRPRLSTFGDGSHHPAIIKKTVEQINACLPSNRQVEVLQANDATASIKLYFVPLKEFDRFAKEERVSLSSTDWGAFFLRWNSDYEIEKATVLIASDKLSGRRLQHFVLEELTQSFGLAGDSNRFEDSVFFENSTEKKYGSAVEFSRLDRQLIRFLYEHVPAGTPPVELGVLLERHWQP